MSKGSSVLLAIVMAIGGFMLGHVVGSRSATDSGIAGEEVQAADVAVAGDVERYKIPVTSAQPSKGPNDALVTIVEFSEFQCPFCSRVLPTMKQVQDTYGDKVRVVWRNNPLGFHNNAGPAAEAGGTIVFDASNLTQNTTGYTSVFLQQPDQHMLATDVAVIESFGLFQLQRGGAKPVALGTAAAPGGCSCRGRCRRGSRDPRGSRPDRRDRGRGHRDPGGAGRGGAAAGPRRRNRRDHRTRLSATQGGGMQVFENGCIPAGLIA